MGANTAETDICSRVLACPEVTWRTKHIPRAICSSANADKRGEDQSDRDSDSKRGISENAHRQIAAWKKQAKPPDSETIRRWTKQTWEYQGAFDDEPERPIDERWIKCRDFLRGKGMIAQSDSIGGAEKSAFDPERYMAEN